MKKVLFTFIILLLCGANAFAHIPNEIYYPYTINSFISPFIVICILYWGIKIVLPEKELKILFIVITAIIYFLLQYAILVATFSLSGILNINNAILFISVYLLGLLITLSLIICILFRSFSLWLVLIAGAIIIIQIPTCLIIYGAFKLIYY